MDAEWEKHRLGWISTPPWPPVNQLVEVWWRTQIRQARWDGQSWIDEETKEVLVGVMYWRKIMLFV